MVAPPPAAAEPSGPIPGTPLAIGASTVAGAALLRNLALMGGPQLSGVTPDLAAFGKALQGVLDGAGVGWFVLLSSRVPSQSPRVYSALSEKGP